MTQDLSGTLLPTCVYLVCKNMIKYAAAIQGRLLRNQLRSELVLLVLLVLQRGLQNIEKYCRSILHKWANNKDISRSAVGAIRAAAHQVSICVWVRGIPGSGVPGGSSPIAATRVGWSASGWAAVEF